MLFRTPLIFPLNRLLIFWVLHHDNTGFIPTQLNQITEKERPDVKWVSIFLLRPELIRDIENSRGYEIFYIGLRGGTCLCHVPHISHSFLFSPLNPSPFTQSRTPSSYFFIFFLHPIYSSRNEHRGWRCVVFSFFWKVLISVPPSHIVVLHRKDRKEQRVGTFDTKDMDLLFCIDS